MAKFADRLFSFAVAAFNLLMLLVWFKRDSAGFLTFAVSIGAAVAIYRAYHWYLRGARP